MLEDTGERIIPKNMKITNGLLLEHLARYYFATHFAYGRVLDVASGSGYGTHILAKKYKKKITEVIGLDNSKDAIDYAKHNYYHPLSTFIVEDITHPMLPNRLGQFDTIVSFETIEHIENEKQFLSNIYRLLKPKGTLILSTPFGQGRGKRTNQPFHVHQLTVNEFMNLFPTYKTSSFYVQNGVLIEPASSSTGQHYPIGIAICIK